MRTFLTLMASVGGFMVMAAWTYYNVVRPDIKRGHQVIVSWMVVAGIIMLALSVSLALALG